MFLCAFVRWYLAVRDACHREASASQPLRYDRRDCSAPQSAVALAAPSPAAEHRLSDESPHAAPAKHWHDGKDGPRGRDSMRSMQRFFKQLAPERKTRGERKRGDTTCVPGQVCLRSPETVAPSCPAVLLHKFPIRFIAQSGGPSTR